MRKLPILFSGPMVRALLREIETPGNGKTQTRRVLTADCDEAPALAHEGAIIAYDDGEREYRWPRTYAVGDHLYVREAWQTYSLLDGDAPRDLPKSRIWYEADAGYKPKSRFRQGMHMPRWASRITLIVTDVRVQQLQEISEADAIAEGVEFGDGIYHVDHDHHAASALTSFCGLWHSLNADRGFGWDANPWVAAYTFTPALGNVDRFTAEATTATQSTTAIRSTP